jgi:hypothetical protein
MTPSQEIIARMSPIELSMLMDHGAVLPAHLEEKAMRYRKTGLNEWHEEPFRVVEPRRKWRAA